MSGPLPSEHPAPPQPGIARATVFGFIAEAMVFPAGLVTAAYLTRSLGAAQYGQLSLIYAVLSPVVWLASSTFAGRTGLTLLADARDWRPMAATLLRANVVLGLGSMLLFLALAPWFATVLGSPDLAPFLWVAAVEIVLMPITRIHRDALVARGQYTWPALATLAFQLARLALILSLVAAGWALLGVILANLGARAVELVACRARLRLPVRGAVQGWLRPLRSQVGSLFGYAFCLQLFNRVDLLMLGFLGTPVDVLGHYGAAQNLALAPGLFAMVFGPLLIAALRRTELAPAPEEALALRNGSARLVIAIWAMAAPVAAGATGLVVLLFGSGFASSGEILAWLGVGAGGGLVLAVLSAHQVANRRYARPLLAAIPMLVVAVALQVVWIPRHGALGAAWATATAAILAAIIAQGFDGLRNLLARSLDLVRMVCAGAAGYFGTQLAARVGMPSPVDILLGAIVTGTVLLLVRLASWRDLRLLAAQFLDRTPVTRMI